MDNMLAILKLMRHGVSFEVLLKIIKSSRKNQKCHPRFQIKMNFFMGSPPDVKSILPQFFVGVSPEKNNEF
jgi:hypothetical protein